MLNPLPLLVVGIAAIATGYAISRISNRRIQLLAGVFWALAPVSAYTIAMSLAPPAPPGFWQWWAAGMVMIAPALAIWIGLGCVGFLIRPVNRL